MSLKVADFDRIITDFDGVLTDNCVWVDEFGHETVRCSRADGLALNVLKVLDVEVRILSTEANTVVNSRAQKLGICADFGVPNKSAFLADLAAERNWDLQRTMYVGNDLNDYNVMRLCGIRVCPSDSHPEIKSISNEVLKTSGGKGVFRELVEHVLGIQMLSYL